MTEILVVVALDRTPSQHVHRMTEEDRKCICHTKKFETRRVSCFKRHQ